MEKSCKLGYKFEQSLNRSIIKWGYLYLIILFSHSKYKTPFFCTETTAQLFPLHLIQESELYYNSNVKADSMANNLVLKNTEGKMWNTKDIQAQKGKSEVVCPREYAQSSFILCTPTQ